MFDKLIKRIKAYKKISAEMAIQEAKMAEYNALVNQHLNYPIIRDLINSAAKGVIISLVFKDGTKMDIKRDESVPDDMYNSQLF